MEIKVNVDEKSGKITQLTFSGDGLGMDAVQKALSAKIGRASCRERV